MTTSTLFISYKFDDLHAIELVELVRSTAKTLSRTRIADGKSIDITQAFHRHIIDFIVDDTDCVIGIFTLGDHGNSNILFEIGIAFGARKPVILIAENKNIVPSMLSAYEIVTLNRDRLNSQKEFRAKLEQKLRAILQSPTDHLVEEKLQRRYSPEEIKYLRDYNRFRAVIESIRTAQLEKAIGILKNAIEKGTTNPDAYFLLAECHYLNGCSKKHPEETSESYQKQLEIVEVGLQLEPRNILCLSNKSRGQLRTGKFAEAQETILRLLSIDKNFSVAHYDLSCVYALLEQKVEMIEWLTSAIELNESWREFAKGDPDFTSYRPDSDWRLLIYETNA
jgi:tetratricopeptide (TPR) repeat protein